MLEQTFMHIPGVGRRTEQDLWSRGLRSWNDAASFSKRFGLVGSRMHQRLDEYIPKSREAVRMGDASFFRRLSSLGEAWRLFPEFSDRCVFLDIETTGLSPVFDTVTLVGLYDGNRYEVFVEGHNLDDLPERLQSYSLIVTFNGSGFDLRFLRLRFPDLSLPKMHIDLRWASRRLGCVGGLKLVEKHFGILRDADVADVDGFDATVLWSRYLRGQSSALDKLIAYNRADVVHLKAIMELTYDRLSEAAAGQLWLSKPRFRKVAAFPAQTRSFEEIGDCTSQALAGRLVGRIATPSPRIVGIDLTGSERRATGWALLEGCNAVTMSLVSDKDLVDETVKARPDVVSIDSPLSVPEGWTRDQIQVDSSAPIYRKCELGLKRMGISVFWCLLPSMKSLTLRGMRLADELRSHGLTVIESYPGAAQDILGIPRKGASLEELKWGLSRAGIEGAYVQQRVSHDEVDAITSALVGLFYLADDYIALGTEREDFLIVPRSSRINYRRLETILAATDLAPVNSKVQHRLKCKFDAPAEPHLAFAD